MERCEHPVFGFILKLAILDDVFSRFLFPLMSQMTLHLHSSALGGLSSDLACHFMLYIADNLSWVMLFAGV
jgi:hypothetical protein